MPLLGLVTRSLPGPSLLRLFILYEAPHSRALAPASGALVWERFKYTNMLGRLEYTVKPVLETTCIKQSRDYCSDATPLLQSTG